MARLVLAAAVLALPGCGGDDEDAGDGAATGREAPTTAATGTGGRTTEEGSRRPPAGGSTERAPEGGVPGGPGDEIPARGPADFTGRDGRVVPRVVHVPPYLGIGVTLRSADGRAYGLRVGGRTLRVGGDRRSASATLEGLRPGAAYEGAVLGGRGGSVRIEASAEPGP